MPCNNPGVQNSELKRREQCVCVRVCVRVQNRSADSGQFQKWLDFFGMQQKYKKLSECRDDCLELDVFSGCLWIFRHFMNSHFTIYTRMHFIIIFHMIMSCESCLLNSKVQYFVLLCDLVLWTTEVRCLTFYTKESFVSYSMLMNCFHVFLLSLGFKLKDFLRDNETLSHFLHHNASLPHHALKQIVEADVNLEKVEYYDFSVSWYRTMNTQNDHKDTHTCKEKNWRFADSSPSSLLSPTTTHKFQICGKHCTYFKVYSWIPPSRPSTFPHQ